MNNLLLCLIIVLNLVNKIFGNEIDWKSLEN